MTQIENRQSGYKATKEQDSSLNSLKTPAVPSIWSQAMTGQLSTVGSTEGAATATSQKSNKLEFKNTNDWDGSYPPPAGKENILPPSAVSEISGKTYYRLQIKSGNWITATVPFHAEDLRAPSYGSYASQVSYSGVISDVVPIPAGATLPSHLPKAEAGKAGVFNNVFVDEKGLPLTEYGTEWTPPSWVEQYKSPAGEKDPYLRDYPYKWEAGMVLDGPWENKGTLGEPAEPSTPTSATSLMGAMGRGRKDLPNEVIAHIKYGETQVFEFDVPAVNSRGVSDRGYLGLIWYGDGGGGAAHAPVRIRLFDEAGKLLQDRTDVGFYSGFLKEGHYRVELTGAAGDYRKDGKGNSFLIHTGG